MNKNINMKLYEDYIAKCDLEMCDALFDDLRCCINDHSSMFFFILPKISKFFSDSLLANGPKIVEIIIRFGDETQIFDFVYRIMRNEIKLLDDDEISELFGMFFFKFHKFGTNFLFFIVSELMVKYDITHQNLAWQIVRAHGFKTKTFISLLDKFDITCKFINF